jgi:hypothetical protein
VHHGHFREAEHHDERYEARQCEAEDDRRAGIPDGEPATHEQARADRASQTNHHDLSSGETAVKAAFAFADRGGLHGPSVSILDWKNGLRPFFGHYFVDRRQKAWFLPAAPL